MMQSEQQKLKDRIFHLFFANKISVEQMEWLEANIDTICCEYARPPFDERFNCYCPFHTME